MKKSFFCFFSPGGINRCFKIISLLTAFLFTLTNTLIPGTMGVAEANATGVSIQGASSLNIPSALGLIDESKTGISDKTVVYIQDAHDSLEAQLNIASMIDYLVKEEGVKTVFEEGYEGPVPTDEFFGFIKDKDIKQATSYYFLDKLRIGGAEYAHINRTQDFNLIGADSLNLHLQNIAWSQESSKYQKETEKDVKEIAKHLKQLQNRYFPKELKTWIKLRNRFDNEQLSLLDYIKRTMALQTMSDELRASEYPSITLLLKAEGTEDEVLLEQVGDIDSKALFAEIDKLETDLANQYLSTDRDKDIFSYSKSVSLIERLNKLEVTPDEYEVVKEKLTTLNTQDLADFIAKNTKKDLILSNKWEDNLGRSINFYTVAKARDKAIESSLENFINNPDEKVAVLVYGGFHKSGIREILHNLKLNYEIVSPNITKQSKRHKEYYKVLMSKGYLDSEAPENLSNASRPMSLFQQAKVLGVSGIAAVRSAVAKVADVVRNLLTSTGTATPKQIDRKMPKMGWFGSTLVALAAVLLFSRGVPAAEPTLSGISKAPAQASAFDMNTLSSKIEQLSKRAPTGLQPTTGDDDDVEGFITDDGYNVRIQYGSGGYWLFVYAPGENEPLTVNLISRISSGVMSAVDEGGQIAINVKVDENGEEKDKNYIFDKTTNTMVFDEVSIEPLPPYLGTVPIVTKFLKNPDGSIKSVEAFLLNDETPEGAASVEVPLEVYAAYLNSQIKPEFFDMYLNSVLPDIQTILENDSDQPLGLREFNEKTAWVIGLSRPGTLPAVKSVDYENNTLELGLINSAGKPYRDVPTITVSIESYVDMLEQILNDDQVLVGYLNSAVEAAKAGDVDSINESLATAKLFEELGKPVIDSKEKVIELTPAVDLSIDDLTPLPIDNGIPQELAAYLQDVPIEPVVTTLDEGNGVHAEYFAANNQRVGRYGFYLFGLTFDNFGTGERESADLSKTPILVVGVKNAKSEVILQLEDITSPEPIRRKFKLTGVSPTETTLYKIPLAFVQGMDLAHIANFGTLVETDAEGGFTEVRVDLKQPDTEVPIVDDGEDVEGEPDVPTVTELLGLNPLTEAELSELMLGATNSLPGNPQPTYTSIDNSDVYADAGPLNGYEYPGVQLDYYTGVPAIGFNPWVLGGLTWENYNTNFPESEDLTEYSHLLVRLTNVPNEDSLSLRTVKVEMKSVEQEVEGEDVAGAQVYYLNGIEPNTPQTFAIPIPAGVDLSDPEKLNPELINFLNFVAEGAGLSGTLNVEVVGLRPRPAADSLGAEKAKTPEEIVVMLGGASPEAREVMLNDEKVKQAFEAKIPLNVYINHADYVQLNAYQQEEFQSLAERNSKLKVVIFGAPEGKKVGSLVFTSSPAAEEIKVVENNIFLSVDAGVPVGLEAAVGENKFRYQADERVLGSAILYAISPNQRLFEQMYGLEKKDGFFVTVSDALKELVQNYEASLSIGRAA